MFFFNDPATSGIYTLSLHDPLPICRVGREPRPLPHRHARRTRGGGPACFTRSRHVDLMIMAPAVPPLAATPLSPDRKSTRLNSSHANISYAVFRLQKYKMLYHYIHY